MDLTSIFFLFKLIVGFEDNFWVIKGYGYVLQDIWGVLWFF
jgi:hypothetical protein